MNLSDSINGYLDGKLSAEDIRVLEAELSTSKEARAIYWEIASTHTFLDRSYSEGTGEQIGETLSQPIPPRTLTDILWKFAPLAAAAAIVIGFFAFQSSDPTSPALVESSGFIARWDNNWRFLKASDLNLREGERRELVFVNGVRVALEGPITGGLVSPGRMTLDHGRIGVHVPPGAEGFTVGTPEGEVVDFGTRFGIDISGNKLRAEVFEGRIDVNVAGENYRMEGQASLEVIDKQSSGIAIGSNAAAYPMPSSQTRSSEFGRFNEPGPITNHHPTEVGQWAGDFSRTVGPLDGITPRTGTGMLQLLSTTRDSGSHPKSSAQVWRVIDLKSIRKDLGRRAERVRLSGWCNRVAGDAQTDTKFMFELGGQAGSQDTFHWSPVATLRSQGELLSDSDPKSWERIDVELQIPADLRFLIVTLSAQENVYNDDTPGSPEFDGHFIDDVELEFSASLRASLPEVRWSARDGSWMNAANWADQTIPVGRCTAVIPDKGNAVIAEPVIFTTGDIVLGMDNDAHARINITESGTFTTGAHETIIGYHSGAEAKLIVNGQWNADGPIFVGRNNRHSLLEINGGSLESTDSIRISQYDTEPDTIATLRIDNGGFVRARSLSLINDHSSVYVEDGILEVDALTIGGSNGQARFIQKGGIVKVSRDLSIQGGTYSLTGGELWVKGDIEARYFSGIVPETIDGWRVFKP